jgi:hypothetical protein
MTLDEVKNAWLKQMQPNETGIKDVRRIWMNGKETVQTVSRSQPLLPKSDGPYCIPSCKHEGNELENNPMIQSVLCVRTMVSF